MSFTNEQEAFCLASTYGFNPSRIIYPARARTTDPGKFEPDRDQTAETRCMVLAHWKDRTNIIVKYNPADLDF